MSAATGTGPVVGVVGSGTLGVTVVHACLTSGSPVTLLVRGGAEGVARKTGAVRDSLAREVAADRLAPEAASRAAQLLRVTTDPEELARSEVVVESVSEDLTVKSAVIAMVESVVDDDCLIASTTSTIPSATLAVGAARPDRIVVAHYFWPAHRMPLVEIAVNARTSPQARRRLAELLAAQGKEPLRTADRPGFLTTRALFASWDAAMELVCRGADPARVDEALEQFGWRLGPFRVMDATGAASVATIHGWVGPSLGDRFTALERLREVVDLGLGPFYHRDATGRRTNPAVTGHLRRDDPHAPDPDHAQPQQLVAHVMEALAAEVGLAVSEGVVDSWDEAAAAYDRAFGYAGTGGGLAAWTGSRLPVPAAG